jgi:uncharacterized protein
VPNHAPKPRRALMVVAKRPAAGKTKTRLCPPLSGGQAATLYECFLRDTLAIIREAAAQLPLDPIIVYQTDSQAEDDAYFAQLAPDFARFAQVGNNLSERLHNATSHALTALGYQQAAIMNSDGPTLPAANLVAAFTSLDDAEVSLGPTDDGGYYLIALKQPAPNLFLPIQMSTPTVAAETLAQAAAANLKVALLPTSTDIDYIADLQRLAATLPSLPASIAVHTRQFLAAHPGLLEGQA